MKDEFIPILLRINPSQLRMFLLIFMQSLDSRIIFILQKLLDRNSRIALHEIVDCPYVSGIEDFPVHRLIDRPHNLSHVQVAVQLWSVVKTIHRIDAQQIEGQTVWHDVVSGHGAALLGIIDISCRADIQTPCIYRAKCQPKTRLSRYSGLRLLSAHRKQVA